MYRTSTCNHAGRRSTSSPYHIITDICAISTACAVRQAQAPSSVTLAHAAWPDRQPDGQTRTRQGHGADRETDRQDEGHGQITKQHSQKTGKRKRQWRQYRFVCVYLVCRNRIVSVWLITVEHTCLGLPFSTGPDTSRVVSVRISISHAIYL